MVKLKPEKGGDEINVELNDRKDGTYLAKYTVDKLYGKLTLSVCLRGAHIKGSPFAVNVEPLRNVRMPRFQFPEERNLRLEQIEALRLRYEKDKRDHEGN